MAEEHHILNGDALKERFPAQIDGEVIVFRECLVSGDVGGETEEAFFERRAAFLSQAPFDSPKEEYFASVVPEFEKINAIQPEDTVYLWFEDDLFCQVNLWYAINRLAGKDVQDLRLVRPMPENPYNFGGLSQHQLVSSFEQSVKLERLDELAKLWPAYRENRSEDLKALAEAMEENYPFILPAVVAHLARVPANGLGRPERTLQSIIDELGTRDFGPVFQEFSKREAIYGFGDLQVKRLMDSL